ncbi:hypothetical protein BH11ACT8_BH11ACT8_25940 [soil metagenome]
MFGQQWDPAEATIVDRHTKWNGDGVATHTFVADVRLSSGETFRATVKEPTIATDFWPPEIRDVVAVLVRPKDRKVKFDKDDDRLSAKAYRATRESEFESSSRQPPGSPPPGWPATTTTTTGLPEGVAEKLAQLGLTGETPVRYVSAGSTDAQQVLSAFLHQGAPGTDPAPPATESPETRLLTLGALREKGLLTEEEYTEQRRRILEEL